MNPSTNFCSQFNCLLRKNLIQQKRDTCITVWLFLFLLSLIQTIINNQLSGDYSPPGPHPKESPALLHVPAVPHRALRTISSPFVDLAPELCRSARSCPVTFLFTGDNRIFGLSLAEKILPESIDLNSSQVLQSLDNMVLGSEIGISETTHLNFQDHAFISNIPSYSIQLDQFSTNSTRQTSIIIMMTRIAKPAFGKAFIEDLEVGSETKEIYNRMGYCLKKGNILWGTLTGREHLLFYGTLRNLRGSDLTMAVRYSLESVQLISDGISGKIVKVNLRRGGLASLFHYYGNGFDL